MEIFAYICVFVLFVFALGTSIWLIVRRLPYNAYEGMTDEQITAIDHQNNVLSWAFFISLILASIFYIFLQLFPDKEELVTPLGTVLSFVMSFVVFGYIGISSIRYRASILTGRSKKMFIKGQSAVQMGIFILVLIGLALYVAWVKLTGQ